MGWFGQFLGEITQVWGATQRSPGWDKVRDEHIRKQPSCSGCGISFRLEAHHILPFHVRPELELDPDNLITLCRDCHWNLGHLRDWALYNPYVVEDAQAYLCRFQGARRK